MKVHDSAQLCELYSQMFTAYIDRSLPAHVERELSDHLVECPGCTERLEGMKQLVEELSGLGTPEASPELAWAIKRAVQREVRREEEAHLLRPLPFLVSATAAAILLVAVIAPSEDATLLGGRGSMGGSDLDAVQSTQLENFVLPPRLNESYRAAVPYATASLADTATSREPSRVTGLAVRF
jgi:anti-sigma factor RsiW